MLFLCPAKTKRKGNPIGDGIRLEAGRTCFNASCGFDSRSFRSTKIVIHSRVLLGEQTASKTVLRGSNPRAVAHNSFANQRCLNLIEQREPL